jgi:hypothetical protein
LELSFQFSTKLGSITSHFVHVFHHTMLFVSKILLIFYYDTELV